MRNADEMRDFLTTRRAKVTPERAGLPAYGRQRRVSGLRREEVALLAGISVEYYTRLERGTARGVSDDVLDSVSRALQLDEAERESIARTVRARVGLPELRRLSSNGRRTPRARLWQGDGGPDVQPDSPGRDLAARGGFTVRCRAASPPTRRA
jgi:transcriptional regulator with XRE-family HTH domain